MLGKTSILWRDYPDVLVPSASLHFHNRVKRQFPGLAVVGVHLWLVFAEK